MAKFVDEEWSKIIDNWGDGGEIVDRGGEIIVDRDDGGNYLMV